MGVPGVRVLSTSQDHHFATAGDVILYYWYGEVTLASVKATRAVHASVAKQNPEGVRVLAVIESGINIPGTEVRETSAMIDREVGGSIRAHATVIPGHGFWVATARSVLGTVFFLSRSMYPRKVFSAPEEAISWLAKQGAAPDGAKLLTHLGSVRRGLPALTPQTGS
jgi:hypothetical protein